MERIKIINFGPIKKGFEGNNGWIDIKRVSIFIGNQGSGKSTIAKVISTLTWLEKAFNRGDYNKDSFVKEDFEELCSYQRIENYFKPDTQIEYEGELLKFKYIKGKIEIDYNPDTQTKYTIPKIMYVPAERNFLSSIENPFSIKKLPETLREFAEELRKGQLEYKNELIALPIGNTKYEYNEASDTAYLLGSDFKLNMLETASGYQSFIPLFLVTKFLSDELTSQKENDIEKRIKGVLTIEQNQRREQEISKIKASNISDIEKEQSIKKINARYINSCFINIVEEPEQNLFPTSQWQILQSLLEYNNLNSNNKLILATHSPYIINFLTLAVKAGTLKSKNCTQDLDKIISLNATLNGDELSIYELDENYGSIHLLDNYQGLPSDENYLNDNLGKFNDQFIELLKIEDRCK